MSPSKDAITKPLDIYVRVSRVGGRDGDSFISPGTQEERCRGLATAKGYKVGEVFTDLDQSGGKMERPAFDQALARVAAGQSGGIIVAKLDRFARNTRGLLATVETLEAHGGALICVSPTIDTADPTYGRFLLTLFAALDELELGKIRDAWAVAHDSMIERGVHAGQAPAGYAKGPDKVLVANGHANAIKEAFRMRAHKKANWHEVARWLTDEAVPSRSGNTRWSPGAARKLIGNRAYLGEARCGDKVNTAAHPALVDEQTYRLANRKEKRTGADRGDGRLLGGGLCRCGNCGAGLVYSVTKSGRKQYEYLRCPAACGKGATIAVGLVEPYVVDTAFALLPTLQVGQQDENQIAEQQHALEAAEADLAEIERLHAEGELGVVAYGKALESAERTRDAAAEALAASAATTVGFLALPAERVRGMLFRTQEGILGVEDAYEVPENIPQARRFLKDVLGRVIVQPGRAPVEERIVIEGGQLAA